MNANRKTVKIFHTGDTHLGYTAYRKYDAATGLNQREADLNQAFSRIVDLAIDEKPDIFLHAGDLFEIVRPSNRTISFALGQILRLSRAGIQTILISGNHDSPRMRETGSIFRIFQHLDNIYTVFQGRIERFIIHLPKHNGLKVGFSALPHIMNPEMVDSVLEEFKPHPDCDLNLGIIHGSVQGVSPSGGSYYFSGEDLNEMLVKESYLERKFDYIALGHYHLFTKVGDRAFYSGSPECLTFSEAGKDKGFIDVSFRPADPPSDQFSMIAKFRKIDIRKMEDLGYLSCKNLDSQKAMELMQSKIETLQIKDNIYRLKIKELAYEAYQALDFNKIKELISSALHFELKYEIIKDERIMAPEQTRFGSLFQEFDGFLERYPLENENIPEIRRLAHTYLEKGGGR